MKNQKKLTQNSTQALDTMTINAIAGSKNITNQSDMRNPKLNQMTAGSTSNLGLKSTTGDSKRRRSDGNTMGTIGSRTNPKSQQDSDTFVSKKDSRIKG